ncbi:MAG: HAD family hydrolase [Desulfatibacillaceae bacterium]
MDNGRAAAFFDFDETLITVSSGRMGFQWMRDNGMVPTGWMVKVVAASVLYNQHIMSEERMGEILVTFYKGKSLDEFKKHAPWFYETYLKPHLAPTMVARADYHREAGHALVLISGAPRYVLEPVAEDLGFDHLVCSDLAEGDDGLLTGKPLGALCVDFNKKRLAMKLARDENISMTRSFAYGNHHADIPLLSAVGHPHAVEPTQPLARVARARNWPILSHE